MGRSGPAAKEAAGQVRSGAIPLPECHVSVIIYCLNGFIITLTNVQIGFM